MTEIILTSSVLILLLIILRRVLRGRVSPGVQYALWLLVAARLLIPGTFFPSPVSVVGAAEDLRETARWSVTAVPAPPAVNVPSPSGGGPYAGSAAPPREPADGPAGLFAAKSPAVSQTGRPLNLIWKTGVLAAAGTLALSNLVFYLRLRKKRKRLELPAAPWSGKLPIYEVDSLPSPCLFGLFRPAVYLNEAAMDAEHPEHILAHEYAHYRHGDHLWSILRGVCLAVHWYNPLVWWAAALSRQDCELACDAAVLKKLGEGGRIDYGQTLLGMISRNRNPAALLHTATTMTAGKRAMKERISLIIKQPKMRKITLLLVALLACLLAACTFGGKADTPAEPADAPVGPAIVRETPIAVSVGQPLSSNSNDYSLITDPDEVARLWELYQSFEYEGAYDPTGKGGWFVSVDFLFGDEPNDGADVFFILTQHGIHTLDGEDLLLKDIDKIYTEFFRMSTSSPVQLSAAEPENRTPAGLDPGQEIMTENARSVIAQIQNGAGTGEWLPLMNYMNWRVLAQAAVEAGMDDGDGSLAIVENVMGAIGDYIDRQGPSMTMAEYLYILSAADGLDGAPAEGYGYMIYRMYAVNPGQFAHVVLEMLPEAQQNEVLDFFRGEWYYHRISDSPDMPTREDALFQLESDLSVSVSASPSDMTLHSAGSTFQFQLFNASGIYALTYESSDPSVAAVDQDGIVTAAGPGTAVITMHYEGAGGPWDFGCDVYCDW